MKRPRGTPALVIFAFVIAVAISLINGIVAWIIIGLGAIALIVMLFVMWREGVFVPPTTLIDDVKSGAEKIRNGIVDVGEDPVAPEEKSDV